MCWQCDNPDKTRADYLDLLRGKIKTYGWAVQYVEGKRPGRTRLACTTVAHPSSSSPGYHPHVPCGC
jgi:hypothetical protein